MSETRVFISHSSRDHDVVVALVCLLRKACTLSLAEIRCTSVDGHRLPLGVQTQDALRAEINSAEVFIALVTKASLGSTYVLFEIGARWGAHLPIAPVLAGGVDPSVLSGPLAAINALSCDRRPQLVQIVADVAAALGVAVAAPDEYEAEMTTLLQAARSRVPTGVDSPMPRHTGDYLLTPIDARVLRVGWEIAERSGDPGVSPQSVLAQIGPQGVTDPLIQESLQVLDEVACVAAKSSVSGRVIFFSVTYRGFELLHHDDEEVADQLSRIEKRLVALPTGHGLNRDVVAESLGIYPLRVSYLLEGLRQQGLVELAGRFDDGTRRGWVAVQFVSPRLQRSVRAASGLGT